MPLLKTFSLDFITNKSNPDNVFEIKNTSDFRNRNPKCSDCFLNKGCNCYMYTMIQQNTKLSHVSKIIEFLVKKLEVKQITIEIYISKVVNIKIHNLPFLKLRKLNDLERYISFEPSCKHLRYLGTNHKVDCFNLFFG